MIKVITGIRIRGKLDISNQIINKLKNNGGEDIQIIYINFEFEDYYDICNYKDFNQYIEDRIVNDKKYYLFFYEIQKVDKGD